MRRILSPPSGAVIFCVKILRRGFRVVAESVEIDRDTHQIRRHTNGGSWEYREFACGYKVHYSPNFRKEEVLKKCVFDPEEAVKKAQTEAGQAAHHSANRIWRVR